jgi:hypothetical protein
MAGQRHPFLELVAKRASGSAYEWLLARHDELDSDNFAAVYAGAGRRLGSAPVLPSADELAQLALASVLPPVGWPLAAVARATLLVELCRKLAPDAQLRLVAGQFRTGDNAERAALLKSLPLLPGPERFVEIAIEACRSSVQSIFEAIACENPYPARFFPEPNFNQLVLKAFFSEIAVQRIFGLHERRSAELVRMAHAYASERRAAGRPVPSDLNVVTGNPTPILGTPGAKP